MEYLPRSTYIYPKNQPNVGKYASTMEHLGIGGHLSFSGSPVVTMVVTMGLHEVMVIHDWMMSLE